MKTRVVCSTLLHYPISFGGACGTPATSASSTPGWGRWTRAVSPGTARATSTGTSHTLTSASPAPSPASHLNCMTPEYACRRTPKVQGTCPARHSDGPARRRCSNHNCPRLEHCEPFWVMCEYVTHWEDWSRLSASDDIYAPPGVAHAPADNPGTARRQLPPALTSNCDTVTKISLYFIITYLMSCNHIL